MSASDTKKNEIRSNHSKARKLPKEKGLKNEDGRLNPRRTLADFPKPKPLPLGTGIDKGARYYGQTCKLLKLLMGGGENYYHAENSPDFPLALDGEFGTYQGTRSGFQMQGGGEVAVIKFAHCTGLLPDDGTWFEVID